MEDSWGEFEDVLMTPPQVILREAENIINSGQIAREEASNAMTALMTEMARVQERNEQSNFVTVNVSRVLPTPSMLPEERFLLYSISQNEQALDILPLELTRYLTKVVTSHVSRRFGAQKVLRCIGLMGEGKSYAAFVVFLKSLTKGSEKVRLCYIPNPRLMLEQPHLIIEMLFLAFANDVYTGAGDDVEEEEKDILTYLKTMYVGYRPDSKKSEDQLDSVVQILRRCKKWCLEHDKLFVILLDQENELYRKRTSNPEYIGYELLKRESTTTEFIQLLAAGRLASSTILVSSARSDEVRLAQSSSILLKILPTFPADARPLTMSFIDLLRHSKIVDNAHIIAWRDYFYRDQSPVDDQGDIIQNQESLDSPIWVPLLEKVKITTFLNPLQTVRLLQYFSKTRVADAKACPLQAYYENFSLRDSHAQLMKSILLHRSDVRYITAYHYILIFLDYHLYNTVASTEKAGQFLWKRLQGILGSSGTFAEAQDIIDARFMILEEGKTPRSSSMFARFILTSLPSYCFNYPTFTEIFNQPGLESLRKRIASLDGHFLEHSLSGKLQSFAFQISVIYFHQNAAYSETISFMKLATIEPRHRLFFRPMEIDVDLKHLIHDRDCSYDQWAVLIPAIPNCKDLDFALLFLPSGTRSPILFPIQATVNLNSHDPSDSIFRNDRTNQKNRGRKDHPVMAAFQKYTNGQGRVQFIWVTKTKEQLLSGSKRSAFDKDSWFTVENDWLEIKSDFPGTADDQGTLIDLSTLDVGYPCYDRTSRPFPPVPFPEAMSLSVRPPLPETEATPIPPASMPPVPAPADTDAAHEAAIRRPASSRNVRPAKRAK